MIKLIRQNPALFLFYLFSLTLCFLIFKQSDLTHTYTSSYAYLQGHVYDFYDYNKVHMGGNDYLPLMYVIFALWNLPLKLFGLLTYADLGVSIWQLSTPLEIFWSKLLLCSFFLACVILLEKITKLLHANVEDGLARPSILFATSPIAIFAVFIFSQYDIFGVFFTLLGLYFYFQKRFWYFAFLFSIAISFKYFAAFIYLPLVLIIEKRPLYIARYGLIGLLVTALQVGAYWHSDIFQASFFALAGAKTGEAMHRGKAIYILILYGCLCAYAYFSKVRLSLDGLNWQRSAIFTCSLAYALMFVLINWHPQWLLILMPFISLSVLFIRHQKTFIIVELIAYIAFIWLCVNGWKGNVDVTMAQDGILRDYIPKLTYFGADILGGKIEGLVKVVFNLYLFSPFIFWAVENRPLVRARFKSFFKQFGQEMVLDKPDLRINQMVESPQYGLYWARILISCYFFLAITLLCIALSVG